MDKQTTCFAYKLGKNGKPKCDALEELYCERGCKCSFYATREQVSLARERSRRRLFSMGLMK